MGYIFASAGLVTSVFYLLIILFSKENHTNKWFLILFIVLLNLSLLPVLFIQSPWFSPLWINASFGLLWGPALYFYVVSLLRKKMNYKFLLFHCLPFLIYYSLAVFFHSDVLPGPPDNMGPHSQGVNDTSKIIFSIIQSISLFGYSVYTLIILNKHERNIQDHFSYKDVYLTIRWSYGIIISFVSAYLCVMLVEQIIGKHLHFLIGDIQMVLIASFVYILGYLGIRQQPVYLSVMDELDDSEVVESNAKEEDSFCKEKYVRNKLSEDVKEEYKCKLLAFMEKEKPYLQTKLSIADLSDSLEIPKHFISQIINDSLGQTFYSFINSYRVKEVKKRIQDDEQDKYTLLAIAFDSGFNSKSGFNNNFKLETGMTPFEFRGKIKNTKTAS
ncbi:helix-turn-helix domain-containing protein [Labilibaculum sp.]|uniref:helix-turn-helix domain-containing protein n=1 Tax=Labilibaculum sp. TaxID=2060723 RepID=UPI003562459B